MKKTMFVWMVISLVFFLTSCQSSPVITTETKAEGETQSEQPATGQGTQTPADSSLPNQTGSAKIELGKPITMGDYEVTVQKLELVKDWEKKDLLKITYDWKNNSDSEQMASLSIRFNAYQDGIESGMQMIMSDDVDLGIGQKNVRPGYGQTGVQDGILIDVSKPVELELTELLSFGNDKWTLVVDPDKLK